jgi:hypothetical protein
MRAGEAAVDRAPAGSSRDACQRIRRIALIEFEVRRTPGRGDGRIAYICGTSPSTVTAVRRDLDAADRASP